MLELRQRKKFDIEQCKLMDWSNRPYSHPFISDASNWGSLRKGLMQSLDYVEDLIVNKCCAFCSPHYIYPRYDHLRLQTILHQQDEVKMHFNNQ